LSKNKRPPFEGLYIYGLLTLLAFVLSDLAILKTQLYLETLNVNKTSAPNFKSSSFSGGLSVRNLIPPDKYQRIVDRNLFNSDGIIPPPFGGSEDVIDDDSMPVKSDLPIQVIGTIVHANPYRSIASLALQGEEAPAALKVGGALRDLAEILAVFRRRVIFRNLKNQKLEYIEIPEDPEITQRKSKIQAPKFQNLGIEPAIKQAGNNFSVSRADVKNQLNNYTSLLKTARAVPYTDPATGELVGFKVTNLQPGSLFQKLGIQPGDVIKGVNGEPINSVNRALEVFANLKGNIDDLDNVNIGVERNGSDQSLNYNVTD
jgi:general secretion pathway protein C